MNRPVLTGTDRHQQGLTNTDENRRTCPGAHLYPPAPTRPSPYPKALPTDTSLLADYSDHNDDQQACETINVMHIDPVQASIDPVVTITPQEAANVKEQRWGTALANCACIGMSVQIRPLSSIR